MVNRVAYLSFLEGSIAVLKTFISHIFNGVGPMLGAGTRPLHKRTTLLLLDLLINLHRGFRTVNPTGLSESLKVVNSNNGSIFVLLGISVSSACAPDPKGAGSQGQSGWFAALLSIPIGAASQGWE